MRLNDVFRSHAAVAAAASALAAVVLSGSAGAQSVEPPQPQGIPALALGTTTPIRVVSLRAGPNGDAPVIGTLHPGIALEVLARANFGWTEVRSPAGTGWAYGSYLASGIGPATEAGGAAAPPSDTGHLNRGIISP